MANRNQDFSTSLPESWELFEKYKAELAAVNDESAKFAAQTEKMKQAASDLNQLMPGLGDAFHGVEGAIRGSGGGLDVLALAIQAAQTYRELYTESANRAAEATKEAFDKIRETTRTALEEQQKFNDMLKKASTPDDQYAEKLEHDTKTSDAHVQQKIALLKVREEAELKQAHTSEEQAKIRQKYQDAINETEDDGAEQHIILMRKTVDQLDKDIASVTAKRKAVKDQITQKVESARISGHQVDPAEMDKLNKEVAGYDDNIADLTRKKTRYNSRLNTDTDATYIGIETHKMERAERVVQPGDDTIAEGVAALAASHAGRITDQQKQSLAKLEALFTSIFGSTAHLTEALKYSLEHHLTQQQEIIVIKNQIQELVKNGAK